MSNGFDTTFNWADERVSMLKEVVKQTNEDIEVSVGRETDSTRGKTKSIWDTALDWVENETQELRERLLNAYNEAKDWFTDTYFPVKDTTTSAYDAGFNWANERVAMLEELVRQSNEETVDTTDSWIDKAKDALDEVGEVVITFVDDRLGDINLNIDFGFDWLADRLEDLLAIPARAFFEFMSFMMQPPGEGEA